VKFVLADQRDYQWARELILRERLSERVAEVLLSPVHGELDPQQLVAWTLEDALRVRVQVQVHKYIWGRDAQGV
jgi:7-carboxy-7-deazaguanine synthase